MDKRTVILKTAMKLFAEYGFHETSMQTIANHSNISKGNIYTYFKSKEELLSSIFQYFTDVLKERIKDAADITLPSKESFIQQLEIAIRERLKFKGFLMMQHRDQSISPEIKQIILSIEEFKLEWLKQNIKAIYGDKIEANLFDAALLLDSLVNGYLRILSIKNDAIELNILAQFLFNRFDVMVSDLIDNDIAPLFPENYEQELISVVRANSSNKEATDILKKIKEAILSQSLEESKREDYIKSIEFIQSEIKEEQPRTFIIKGVLHELATIKGIKGYLNQLKEIIL